MKRHVPAALAALLVLSSPAFAASRVWITEFGGLAPTNYGGPAQIGLLPANARQQLDISGGVQSSAAFNGSTTYIRLLCEVQCAIRVGGTAVTTDTVLPAGLPEYFGVQPGTTISVISAP